MFQNYPAMPNPVNQQSATARTKRTTSADSRRAGTGAFARAMHLLDTITDGNTFRFAELQQLTGLPKASLHRALADLTEQRLVVFDEPTATYRAGFRPLEWANRIWANNDLRKLARDELETLSERTGETVMLSVLADTHVIHLDCVESAQSVRTSVSIGHRVPAWCTAAGKVLMARLPEAEQRTTLDNTAFARFTNNTVTEPDAVMTQLQHALDSGIAIDDEEHHVGIRCLAAPVVDGAGTTVAALSVSAPTFRIDGDNFEHWRTWVQDCAQTIGKRLLPSASAVSL